MVGAGISRSPPSVSDHERSYSALRRNRSRLCGHARGLRMELAAQRWLPLTDPMRKSRLGAFFYPRALSMLNGFGHDEGIQD